MGMGREWMEGRKGGTEGEVGVEGPPFMDPRYAPGCEWVGPLHRSAGDGAGRKEGDHDQERIYDGKKMTLL